MKCKTTTFFCLTVLLFGCNTNARHSVNMDKSISDSSSGVLQKTDKDSDIGTTDNGNIYDTVYKNDIPLILKNNNPALNDTLIERKDGVYSTRYKKYIIIDSSK